MDGSGEVVRADAVAHAEVRTRRFRMTATVVLSVEATAAPHERRNRATGWVPLGLQDPGVRWGDLPPRVLPEEWVSAQGDGTVPGSIVVAEGERRPDGYAPAG